MWRSLFEAKVWYKLEHEYFDAEEVVIMPRELLKFRDGDVGMKIRKDGALELAGVGGDEGMIRKDGMVNPAMLLSLIHI